MNCSILVPVKNESELVLQFLNLIYNLTKYVNEIIFISDFFDINLQKKIEQFNSNSSIKVIVVISPENDLALGIKKAMDVSTNQIIGMYPIDEILPIFTLNEILESFKEQKYVFISATRYSKGGQKYGGPKIMSIISTYVNFLIKLRSKNKITDLTTGIKFWNKQYFVTYEFEKGQGWNSIVMLYVYAFKNNYDFTEIPIISVDRPFGGRKKVKLKQKFYMIKKYLSTFIKLFKLL